MRTDTDRNPEVALRHRCSFCDAAPGAPCVSGSGDAMELPHYSRTPDDHEPTAAERLGWWRQ